MTPSRGSDHVRRLRRGRCPKLAHSGSIRKGEIFPLIEVEQKLPRATCSVERTRHNESHAMRQVHRFERDPRFGVRNPNRANYDTVLARWLDISVAGTEPCSFMLTTYPLRPSPATQEKRRKIFSHCEAAVIIAYQSQRDRGYELAVVRKPAMSCKDCFGGRDQRLVAGSFERVLGRLGLLSPAINTHDIGVFGTARDCTRRYLVARR